MNIIERIKSAIDGLKDIDFSRVAEQRLKTLIGVNSPSPYMARKTLSSPEFASAIGAKVTPMRKTLATGYSVLVEDPEYGKPIYIRIRKGGSLASAGIKSEVDLVSKMSTAIQAGYRNFTFKDSTGESISIVNAKSVRQTGSDPGSRTGNRADLEIVDDEGIAHRISLKKTNATRIAGIIKFLKKRRFHIQQDLKHFIQTNNPKISSKGYVSVRITNPEMFGYCWFGNDIDKNGGVVIGDFDGTEDFKPNESGSVEIECARVFSPNDDVNDLMDGNLTAIYLLMKVNRYLHMDFVGTFNARMAKIYELPEFSIEGINAEGKIVEEESDFDNSDDRKVTMTLGQLKRLVASFLE